VAAGFAAGPGYNRAMLASMAEVDPGLAEVLAISNYFGHETQGEIHSLHAWGDPPGLWPESLYDATAAVVRRSLYGAADTWVQDVAVAREFHLPTVSYEGGQHMLPTGFGDWNDPASVDFMQYMYAFQRSPQLAALYREHLALFSAAGARTPSQWYDIGTFSFYGYWGAKEYVLQTPVDAPKWGVFTDWGALQQDVRAPGDTAGDGAPTLTIPILTGEQGQPFSTEVTATGGDGTPLISLLGGALPPGVALHDLGDGRARLSGIPEAFGRFRFVLRALDADGDAADVRGTLDVDPAGTASQALFAFRGAALPASPLPDGTPNGRFDPVRRTETLDGGAALCVPFANEAAAPLFGPEFNGGAARLAPDSPLNIHGGFCTTALDGPTRAAPPNLNMWTGLRQGQFIAWDGDLNGPAAFEALLFWRREQFNDLGGAGPYAFGPEPEASTLQVDLTGLVGDGDNEVRFAILNRDPDGERWYLSEAAYTRPFIGDGAFRLLQFSGNGAPGARWASFPEPVGTDVHLPAVAELAFAAKQFDDVQAVGLMYRGARWRWNMGFSFSRVFALGTRGP